MDKIKSIQKEEGALVSKEEVLFKLGIKRESGYLYFINKDGDAVRVKMRKVRS